jgi:phage-related protein
VATIDLILRAVNRATQPLQDIAAAADRTADRIDSLNDRIEQTDRAMAAVEGAARLAESGMSSAGREAEVLAGKLSILNQQLDKLDDRTVRVRVKADVDRSWLSRLGGLFSGGGGAGGSSGGLSALLSALPGPLSNPYALGGAAAVGTAAIPFIGTAIGGTILGALGAGLTGLGIYGAASSGTAPATVSALQLAAATDRATAAQDRLAKLQASGKASAAQLASAQASVATAQDHLNKLQDAAAASRAWQAQNAGALKVQAAFSNLLTTAQNALHLIAVPLQGPLIAIASAFKNVLPDVLQPLSVVFQTMAPAVQLIGTTIAKSFGNPAVAGAIDNVGLAFTQFMRAFTPQIPGIADALAKGVNGLAEAFTAHPGMINAMSSVLAFLLRLPGYAVAALGSLTRFANWMVEHFKQHLAQMVADIQTFAHDMAHWWDVIWNNTIGVAIRIGHDVETQFDLLRHSTANIFGGLRHDIAHWGDGAITWLLQAGLDVITGFWDGLKAVWNRVETWILGLAGWIKSHKGPVSLDAQLLVPAGKALMSGLHLGLIQGFAGGPMGFITGLADTIGGLIGTSFASMFKTFSVPGSPANVQNWIKQAMFLARVPFQWFPALELLVGKESGDNPHAINPIAVNGEHAEGLWQMLPSTYAMFGGPPGGIFNPVIEGIAALKYIAATYSSPFNIPGLFSGTYRGYASGGIIPEPVLGIGLRSGSPYSFGERGPETVIPGIGGGFGGGEFTGDLYLDSGEFLGLVRGEIRRSEQAAASSGRSAAYRAMYSTRG